MSAVEPPLERQAEAGHPTVEAARALAEWEPPLGVLSLYMRFDPGDRGGAWRTELRNDLDRILDAAEGSDHETRMALRATAEALLDRFAEREPPLPRGEAGFVEVSRESAAQRWWPSHLFPQSPARAFFERRPVVAPLVDLVERGAPRGIALLSAERVRLLQWAPGRIE